MKKTTPYTHFAGSWVANAVIMAVEMAGVRLITPYFGSSLNTWAVVISVILASLSFGYMMGGLWVTRKTYDRHVHLLFLIPGVYIALVTFWKYQITSSILSLPNIPLFLQSIIACVIFFTIPNFCLAALSPFFGAKVISSPSKIGQSIGVFNMVNTCGSIAGTLATPLLLIPFVGTSNTLYSIAGICVLWSIGMNFASAQFVLILFMPLIVAASAFHHSFEGYLAKKGYSIRDTAYSTNLIFQDGNSTFLITGIFGYESSYVTEQEKSTYLPHLDSLLKTILQSPPHRALVLGSGTLNISSFLTSVFPTIHVSSVDIDQKLVDIAQTFFHFNFGLNHTLITEDGRVFLNLQPKRPLCE